MNILTLLAISVGLSMDAFAVAVASGATVRKLPVARALRLAVFFGAFQAIMPVIGWAAGVGFRSIISEVDHWIAFGLLSLVGGKMIFESTKLEKADNCDGDTPDLCNQSLLMLFGLSVATSIDALVVGLSFSILDVSIPIPALVIGMTTFAISYFGVYLGTKVGHFFEKKVAIVGGLILIGMGIKILVEHLAA